MSWNASVLSTVSSDTEPTVVITFNSAKYIFNVEQEELEEDRGVFLTSVGTQFIAVMNILRFGHEIRCVRTSRWLPLEQAVPYLSKYRNVSGTLLYIPGAGYILLNAGEGTWGQLARNYEAGLWDVLRGLKCIFISYIHGDHHIGLAKILAMRQKLDPLPEESLYLTSNRIYLRDYHVLEEHGFSKDERARVPPILSNNIHWRNKGRNYGDEDQKGSRGAAGELCKTLELQKINTVDVEHRARFSAETVPTQKLVQAGTGATLFIHEVTMANDQVEMACAKMHSTFGQAIDIGRDILLTHSSVRYPKMPPSISEHQAGDPVAAFTFDHANIKIGGHVKDGRICACD
ncbi:beta-lactamase-like protein [Suillus ampliporus]|nr:beta-lactamase-like protein [Suillus ampliporus]